MNNSFDRCGARRLASALLACGCASAQACLGGDAASVAADGAAWAAPPSVVAAAGYTDYTLRRADGIVVHEMLNAAGQVFEVTWNGRGHRPDMARLLGAYRGRLVAASGPGARPMLRRADLVAADLQIHSAVRNRWFSGTAHLPALLPASLPGPVAVPNDSK